MVHAGFVDRLLFVCYDYSMWIRFIHLLFIAALIAGSVDCVGLVSCMGADLDDPLPTERSEEECEAAGEVEFDKLHSGVGTLPGRVTLALQSREWGRWLPHVIDAAKMLPSADAVRGPPALRCLLRRVC